MSRLNVGLDFEGGNSSTRQARWYPCRNSMAKVLAQTDLPTKKEAHEAFTAALDSRQGHVREILHRLMEDPPQVLILEGGLIDERISMALWYSALLNCVQDERPCLECPTCLQIGARVFTDLLFLDGRNEIITIAMVRDVLKNLAEAPRSEGKRIVVLAEAQAIGIEAANALLKAMEEPQEKTHFLILTPQRERLLPTYVSRGWVVTLAWPDLNASISAELQSWSEALAIFLETGKGWFARTSTKGSVSAILARNIIVLIQKTLTDVLTQRSHQETSSLARQLISLSDAHRLTLSEILAQGQESLALPTPVNPSLVLEWLATQIYQICHT